MAKCKQNGCDERLVTASFQGEIDFNPDSEPYESGAEETLDIDIQAWVDIVVAWCPVHGIQQGWFEGPA